MISRLVGHWLAHDRNRYGGRRRRRSGLHRRRCRNNGRDRGRHGCDQFSGFRARCRNADASRLRNRGRLRIRLSRRIVGDRRHDPGLRTWSRLRERAHLILRRLKARHRNGQGVEVHGDVRRGMRRVRRPRGQAHARKHNERKNPTDSHTWDNTKSRRGVHAARSTFSIRPCRCPLEAKTVPLVSISWPSARSLTKPPASRTMTIPAARSQAESPRSQNAS